MKDLACAMLLTFTAILTMSLGLIVGGSILLSYLDKSVGNVYVDNKLVYSGYLYYTDISSIGANGNTKCVTIYKGRTKIQSIAKYVGDSVIVRGIAHE